MTYNFKFLFDFPVDIDVMSSDSFNGKQAAPVEGDLSKDGRISEVQVWIGAERHLAWASGSSAAFLANCVTWIRIQARAAILLEKISSDQLALLILYSYLKHIYDQSNI